MPRLILGHTTHNSIKIWVRGTKRWPVAFIDLEETNGDKVGRTKALALEGEDFYTGVVKWTGLRPNREYRAKVSFGKTLSTPSGERIREAYTNGKFRTFPPPASRRDFTFLLGSCNLHSLGWVNKPDKAWVRISNVASQVDAKFMLHCGDQIYADVPFRPSQSVDHYRDKYLDAWEDCRPAQRVLTELPHYMILDDHEIKNNYSRDSKDAEGGLARVALKAYYEFQHKHNPDTSGDRWRYDYTFNYGACQFFVLDTRTKRTPDGNEMVDSQQLTSLLRWMTRHSTKIKFIVTTVPFVGQVRRPKKDKWCDPAYAGQKERILRHIVRNGIGKVVFLTGDMHNSYHAEMTITEGDQQAKIHEIMSSPINQITPNSDVGDEYVPNHRETTAGGLVLESEIHERSFYANHSNVVAIDVEGDSVRYRTFRTTENEPAARTGRFQP
jgi:phosphodiesterase/alkaline phosphatase D-like protein